MNKEENFKVLWNDIYRVEVVPMIVDRSFKKVFADENHLERLNLLLSTILNKSVKVK